jgi:hypothetical protein
MNWKIACDREGRKKLVMCMTIVAAEVALVCIIMAERERERERKRKRPARALN